MIPYFIRFINDVNLLDIESHDRTVLERFTTASDLYHEGKHGEAAITLIGPAAKADLAKIEKVLTSIRGVATEEWYRQVIEPFVAPETKEHASLSLPLRLYQEEMAAHEYIREKYRQRFIPATLALILPFAATPRAIATARNIPPPIRMWLEERLSEQKPLVNIYASMIEDLRQLQNDLRRLTFALAEGKRLPEPIRIPGSPLVFTPIISTDGRNLRTDSILILPDLRAAVLHDFVGTWGKDGIYLKVCALEGCGRVFIPKDRRQRFHLDRCWREAKKMGKA
jgi:hypothetical protein